MSQEKLWRLSDLTLSEVTQIAMVLVGVLIVCAFPIMYILSSADHTGKTHDLSIVRAGPELNLTATITSSHPSTLGLLSMSDTKVRGYYRISIREDEDRSTFLPILGKEVYNHTLTAEPLELAWTLNPCITTWVDITTNEGYFTQSFKPTAVCG